MDNGDITAAAQLTMLNDVGHVVCLGAEFHRWHATKGTAGPCTPAEGLVAGE